MVDKTHKLNAMIHMIICQWISKVFKRGDISNKKSERFEVNIAGVRRSVASPRVSVYSFKSSNVYSFFTVLRTGIITNQLDKAETCVVAEVTTLIEKIFYLNSTESADIIADFFVRSVYLDMLPSVMHEQFLYYISNDYEI